MQREVSLRGIGLLIGEGEADQEAVKIGAAAGETVYAVRISSVVSGSCIGSANRCGYSCGKPFPDRPLAPKS